MLSFRLPEIASITRLFTSLWSSGVYQRPLNTLDLPPQCVLANPLLYNVMGDGATFRQDAFQEHFNPTNNRAPFFQVFHPAFLDVVGPSPSLRVIASIPGSVFAHEAPVWLPETDEVFFSSNCSGPSGLFDCSANNKISKISMKDVRSAIAASDTLAAPINVTVTQLQLPESIQMTWGSTGPYRSSLLFFNSGSGVKPASLAIVNPAPPHNVTILVDNYFGRQFNSLNDGKIHPKSGKIFFTDVTYGFLKGFKPAPLLPNQGYRFDPDTGHIRVVADGLKRPNGLAFSPDGNIAYIGDTAAAAGFLGRNQTDPATIYAFDVDPHSQVFLNRRVFAYIDAGVPDGIQVDSKGNIYSACGDGVHIWDHDGTLIGKFFLGSVSANMIFADKGELVILANDTVYFAQIAAQGVKVAFA
ncbi:D-lactonohydrolase-like protein [Laetiporus sulphureus 93-53]|uniref:D-lactonohydrolase-like protein n=1 Tax=Laetiporus sulphureus 93-53 TaxID=1314785 RepID=A0A165B4W5_9APHY|nr:D-lactonohydrolase-like protein [Laetiporus sulphureus 93-53]KZT00245.1 D-lactonohydrolase-like protein [Laetiporus sulphureus 93-53]